MSTVSSHKVGVAGGTSDALHIGEALGGDTQYFVPPALGMKAGQMLANHLDPRDFATAASDLIVVADPRLSQLIEGFRRLKIPVFGGCLFSQVLHRDLVFGLNLLKQAGIDTVPTFTESPRLTLSEQILSYEQEHGPQSWHVRYQVSDKISTEFPHEATAEYWSNSVDEMLGHLNQDPTIGNVVVQQSAPSTFEVTLACAFNGKDFIGPPLLVWPQFGLLPRGGLQSPEGCILAPLALDSQATKYFSRLEAVMGAVRYVGFVFLKVDVSSTADSKWRFCARDLSINPPAGFWQAFLFGLEQSPSRFFRSCARGAKFNFEFIPMFSSAIRVSLPPYPFQDISYEDGNNWSDTLVEEFGAYPSARLWVYNDTQYEGLAMMTFRSDYKDSLDLGGVARQHLAKSFNRFPELQFKSDFGHDLDYSLLALQALGLPL